MENYCIIPPYVKTDIKPNIMILMDNAQGMGNVAYTGNYNPNTNYEGYFRPDVLYKYSGGRWEPSPSNAAPPPPAIYISGNILNWAATSKYDLLEKILVGGISASRVSNPHTLVSYSTSWTKVLRYNNNDSLGERTCNFIINNGNIEIKDDTPGSCGYFDNPRRAFDPASGVIVASAGVDEENLKVASVGEPRTFSGALFLAAQKTLSFIARVFDSISSDAEAAKPLAISGGPGSLSAGTECNAYTTTITAGGGTETLYTWSISAGSLPPGLSIGASGTPSTVISGTPTASGAYNFTVRVQDSDGGSDTKTYSITVSDASVAISTLTLPSGNVSVWYRETVSASGACTASTSWAVTAGSLPNGLSLQSGAVNHIDVAGTPSIAGTYNFTLRVTDSAANTATRAFTIVIMAVPPPGLQITTISPLPDGLQSNYYQANVATFGYTCGGGCSTGWSWSITTGTLPPGLSINAAGPCINGDHAYITGTPTVPGTYSFAVSATTPAGCGGTITKAFQLTIAPSLIPIRTTGNLNVKVCTGDYDINCTTATKPTKSGIIQEFWPQARFGLQDFNKQAGVGVPNIANCIEGDPGATPNENFLTAVENAVPIDPVTPLVDAVWMNVDYFATNNASNCNPFRNSQVCLKSFILAVTDGSGAGQLNNSNPSNNAGECGGGLNPYVDNTSCGSANYGNLAKNSCFGFNNDLRNHSVCGVSNLAGRQSVATYIVNTMGTLAGAGYNTNNAPTNTGERLHQAADKGGGVYYEATDASQLKAKLKQAFQDIIKRAAAGTAASVLASGEGSGANLIQAIFYPRSPTLAKGGIFSDEISWIGRLSNYWYYVDPFFGASSIREDTEKDFKLNIRNDYTANFYYDSVAEQTKAELLEDTNTDGYGDVCRFGPRPGVTYSPGCTNPSKVFEKINYLWEGGVELWKRATPRTLKTNIGGGLIDFATDNAATLKPYLNLPDSNPANPLKNDLDGNNLVDIADAGVLIRYVHGEDRGNLRTRSTGVDLDGDGIISGEAESSKVWKLGDVLNSTPKIASHLQLGNYDTTNNDATYKTYLKSSDYLNKGAVFAGGNDGMLHAFKLGKLELKDSATCDLDTNDKACLTGSDLGKELWAFIPKNALPYLKYLTDPGYCHVFTVDLTPYVFDASINKPSSECDAGTNYWDCPKQTKCGNNAECTTETNTLDMANTSWRTILIGGMRYGGACREPISAGTDNVKAPAAGLGYSSYFALDVTDENNPQLLWEFSDPDLGFTTTGPAVVRISARDVSGELSVVNNNKNGRWFVVFGSGPTGPIDTTIQQFMGRSDQNLRLFILDLKTGALLRAIDTGIANAFAGSMLNSTHNVDAPDYQDDVVYIPYVKKPAFGTTWTDGGVLRLLTKEDLPAALDPANWVWSKVMDGIGPVTSSVQRLQHQTQQKLRLYFGTGRYFFEKAADTDDGTTQRHLFGITEPCFINGAFSYADCATTDGTGLTRTTGDLSLVDLSVATGVNDPEGWYIALDSCTTSAGAAVACTDASAYYRTERVITDPLTTTSGLVFFTTYKPYKDECSLGGKSHIWALKYDTGAAPGALLKGKAIVQVSTGAIEQVDLSTAFQEKTGRRSGSLEGVPPTQQGLSLISSPPAVKRVIHVRER